MRSKKTLPAIATLCFAVSFVLSLGLGYGRFRSVMNAQGEEFAKLQTADAELHLTLAERLIAGKGFTLPTPPDLVAAVGTVQPAFEKAPGYPFILSLIFRITGPGFSYFLPQCLMAGLASSILVLVSFEVFGSIRAASFAGFGAALHPVLLNTASQLYNEDWYFCLFLLTLLLYLKANRTEGWKLFFLSGLVAGLAALVREAILAPFFSLIALRIVWDLYHDKSRLVHKALASVAGVVLVVTPWTIRNYRVTNGEFVPVSVASIYLVGLGNNDCVAKGFTNSFYGEDACPVYGALKQSWLTQRNLAPTTLNLGKASAAIGTEWMKAHPSKYLSLCASRLATLFNPLHAHQHLQGVKKWFMIFYFAVFVGPGAFTLFRLLARRSTYSNFPLLSVIVLSIVMAVPMVLVYISQDHRFAVGVHLMLAVLAGSWLVRERANPQAL